MNDDIEKLNAENTRQNNYVSPGNFSKAATSSITTNEQENKRSLAEGIISDLSNQRADIDSIKGAIQVLLQQVEKITIALNNLAPGATQQTAEQGKINMETISSLGDVAEKLVSAYKNLKGNPAPTQSFLDQDYINEQVKKSVMGNFEIGDALVSNLKSKLINKAVSSSVSDALKDTHAPQ